MQGFATVHVLVSKFDRKPLESIQTKTKTLAAAAARLLTG